MYDFDAGDLSLNFANTVDWHTSQKPRENLKSYGDLVTWGWRAGLIPEQLVSQLDQIAVEHPHAAASMYSTAIRLRDAVYRIFSNYYARQPIQEDDLAVLNAAVNQAMSHLQLSPKGDQFEWQLSSDLLDANLILWPVARAAADLLTSDRAARVRICEDDRGCGYLFIDQTKNHSRRWCSMESCGNRAKARRHYSRVAAN